jgi:hypothetical protein
MTVRMPTLCPACVHQHPGGDTCAAFPHGIPAAIVASGGDHTEPAPGDQGVQFRLDPARREHYEDWRATFGPGR